MPAVALQIPVAMLETGKLTVFLGQQANNIACLKKTNRQARQLGCNASYDEFSDLIFKQRRRGFI